MKTVWAKTFGWLQFAVTSIIQVSDGHIPRSKGEWLHFISSGLVAIAVHHAASTDGQK